jgi:hypothetical protein
VVLLHRLRRFTCLDATFLVETHRFFSNVSVWEEAQESSTQATVPASIMTRAVVVGEGVPP